MKKRTKIICTIGPSSWDPKIMLKMYKAGMNGARVNASFADYDEMKRVLGVIRKTSDEIAAILDLKGHKIRLNDIGWTPISVKKGGEIVLGTRKSTKSPQKLYVSYKNLYKDLKAGATILIDDGKVQMRVEKIKETDIYCKVTVGGEIKRLKTVSTPGTELKFPAVTKKDAQDIKWATKLGYDYVAASFVRNVNDVKAVKRLLTRSETKLIAKIEDPQGVRNFDSILKEADAILIARGDMGIEMPLEKVPVLQREFIRKCRNEAKPVIVATHMLESMVENVQPTRAEVNDVATAVFQGSDCVMLSGETSTGQYPVVAVKVMSRIIHEAEKDVDAFEARGHTSTSGKFTDNIAEAAQKAVSEGKVDKVLVLTASGMTARILSRYRMNKDLVVLTRDYSVARQLGISYGIKAGVSKKFKGDRDEVIENAIKKAQELGFINKNDIIMVVSGSSIVPKHEEGGLIEIREV